MFKELIKWRVREVQLANAAVIFSTWRFSKLWRPAKGQNVRKKQVAYFWDPYPESSMVLVPRYTVYLECNTKKSPP